MRVNVKKIMLFIAITFSLTIVFHQLIILSSHPRSFLGLAMVIPLLSVVFVQKIIYKEKILPTLGLSDWSVILYFLFS